MTATHQFKQVTTPSGRVAYEAWTAVYNNYGQNVALSAPTLALLEKLYAKFFPEADKFNAAMAQHTYIVKFEDRSDKSL